MQRVLWSFSSGQGSEITQQTSKGTAFRPRIKDLVFWKLSALRGMLTYSCKDPVFGRIFWTFLLFLFGDLLSRSSWLMAQPESNQQVICYFFYLSVTITNRRVCRSLLSLKQKVKIQNPKQSFFPQSTGEGDHVLSWSGFIQSNCLPPGCTFATCHAVGTSLRGSRLREWCTGRCWPSGKFRQLLRRSHHTSGSSGDWTTSSPTAPSPGCTGGARWHWFGCFPGTVWRSLHGAPGHCCVEAASLCSSSGQNVCAWWPHATCAWPQDKKDHPHHAHHGWTHDGQHHSRPRRWGSWLWQRFSRHEAFQVAVLLGATRSLWQLLKLGRTPNTMTRRPWQSLRKSWLVLKSAGASCMRPVWLFSERHSRNAAPNGRVSFSDSFFSSELCAHMAKKVQFHGPGIALMQLVVFSGGLRDVSSCQQSVWADAQDEGGRWSKHCLRGNGPSNEWQCWASRPIFRGQFQGVHESEMPSFSVSSRTWLPLSAPWHFEHFSPTQRTETVSPTCDKIASRPPSSNFPTDTTLWPGNSGVRQCKASKLLHNTGRTIVQITHVKATSTHLKIRPKTGSLQE